MNTLEFLRKILPDDGNYFIESPSPTGVGFKHHHCESIGEAAAKALHLDTNGVTAYFALSSFREPFLERPDKKDASKTIRVYRVQDNVKLVKSFWLDLDVGDGENKYPSQRDAIIGLGSFLRETGLPAPMVVSSGFGVHVYWPLTETILPGRWKHTATKLKALCAGMKLLADPSRTSDEASVLRPIGTHNRKVKDGKPAAEPVQLIADADYVDLSDFEKRIDTAIKTHGLAEPVARGKPTGVNAPGLMVPNDYPDAYSEAIADKCTQIKLLRDKGGSIPEPVWYAAIQVLHFAKDGDAHIHKWSSPHPTYSASETDTKINQIASMGPASCVTFEQRNADGCKGCPYKGKVTSPIQLGIQIEDVAAPIVIQPTELGEITVEIPPPPFPFRRATSGLYLEQDGVPLRFYRYDLFPMGIIWDDADDFMTMLIRHHLPHEGWQDFSMPAGTLSSQKDLETLLVGKGVLSDQIKYMRTYMTSYLQQLQGSVKMQRLYDALGWKDDTDFVFGKRIFSNDGIHHAGLSRTVPETIIRGITSKGNLDEWTAAASKFTQPGLEAHLFAMCSGFGSPLLPITGFSGCMLSMLGESNAGKTLVARAALTIYGKFEDLQSGAKDTMNARMERLHAMANLPVYFDELTNIEPKELSNLVYMLSQGRGREKLRADSTTRAAAQWSAIALGSTNQSLYSVLSQGKDNAEAEMMRVLEIWVPRHAWFEPQMTEIFNAFRNNYGVAGDHYIKYIVANRTTIAKQIKAITESLNTATGFAGKERFWASLCACVLCGFLSAHQAGLIRADNFNEAFNRLFVWTRNTIIGLRGAVQMNNVDELAGLGQYINHHQSGTLVLYPVRLGDKDIMAIRKRPTNSLVMRVEEDRGLLWIDRKHIKNYLSERQFFYDRVRKHLTDIKVLINSDDRKMLGGGTSEFRSAQIPCWLIDLKSPQLGELAGELIKVPEQS